MSKQDRQGVRTPADIERKYDLGQDFSQIEKLAANAQRSAEMAYKVAAEAYAAASKVTTDIESILARLDALENGSLPSGYTALEYIQSSGTQYIDTGFKPNQDTRLVMDAQITDSATRHLFGARTSASSNMFFAACLSANTVRADFGTKQNTHTVPSVLDRMTWDVSKTGCTIGDTSSTFTAETFSPNVTMALFASNTNGTIVVDTYKAKMKLFACQIYDNGVLVRDFVPVKNSNGDAGLFDRIGLKFYGNAGSGAFTGA